MDKRFIGGDWVPLFIKIESEDKWVYPNIDSFSLESRTELVERGLARFFRNNERRCWLRIKIKWDTLKTLRGNITTKKSRSKIAKTSDHAPRNLKMDEY